MANQYLYDLTDTWNNVATTFDAIKINVRNDNSAAGSSLLRLETNVGGGSATTRFSVNKHGKVFASKDPSVIGGTVYELGGVAGTGLGDWYNTMVLRDGASMVAAVLSATGVVLSNVSSGGSEQGLAFCNGTSFTSPDLRLLRDAANQLAQRNGTNAQTFRVYKTFTDASNYERTEIAHATYSSAEYCILRAATAGTGADNLNLVLSPAGTGSVLANMPDGTTAGGNARGTYCVDLQTRRNQASQVASGLESTIFGGYNNTASGIISIAGGVGCVSSNTASVAIGDTNTASGGRAASIGGLQNTASADYSIAMGLQTLANKRSQFAFSAGQFAAIGDAQRSTMVLRNATTDATATELFLDGSSARATIPNNTCWHADIRIVGRQSTGANHATYHRKCTIYKNTTAGSTTLVGTVQTIGTDEESDANWAVAVTADTTNGSLKIEVTGVAATNIRWVAELSVVEVAYA